MNSFAPVAHARRPQRPGITLVEMLVAMTVSLIMIYGLLHAFANMISYVNDGRAAVEVSGQLRATSHRLQNDLRHPTTPVRSWPTRMSGPGYFEYIEGLGHDTDPLLGILPGSPTLNTTFGDFDDVISMTACSCGPPFVGQVVFQSGGGPVATTVDSHHAEIAWWCVWNDADADQQPGVSEVTLYRRVLLIRPDLAPYDGTTRGLVAAISVNDNPAGYTSLWDELITFYNNNDISVRPEVVRSGGQLVVRMWANSLADLTHRENRFCHRPILQEDASSSPPQYSLLADDTQLLTLFPYEMQRFGTATLTRLPSLTAIVQRGDQLGEDVMQSHVLAFDVKAFDPYAPLLPSDGTGEALTPHDPGYGRPPHPGAPVGAGGFVDLYFMSYVQPRIGAAIPPWAASPNPFTVYPYSAQNTAARVSLFSSPPAAKSRLTTPTYDTWSYHYEQDGVDQDSVLSFDQGIDGLDNDNLNGVDDPAERETSPPYPTPLRGLRISVRVNEPDSRQVKQMSVEQDFTPE